MTEKDQFFFQTKEKNDPVLFTAIEQACEGLNYISETDSPVLAFAGPETDQVSADIILSYTGAESGPLAVEAPVEGFFARLTSIKDWYGTAETEMAKKYLKLKQLLEVSLRELKVIRIGVTRIEIYVVGIDGKGYLVGVRTSAVET